VVGRSGDLAVFAICEEKEEGIKIQKKENLQCSTE
jgi:hypothetical protein